MIRYIFERTRRQLWRCNSIKIGVKFVGSIFDVTLSICRYTVMNVLRGLYLLQDSVARASRIVDTVLWTVFSLTRSYRVLSLFAMTNTRIGNESKLWSYPLIGSLLFCKRAFGIKISQGLRECVYLELMYLSCMSLSI